MLKVGLTGGVASGKSTVLEMFARRGAHTLRADEVAHKLMRPGQPVYERVVEHFGRDILNEDGTIARPRLAQKAFAGRIEELNALVHPAVIDYQDRWADGVAQREPRAVAIIEAALMIEARAHEHMDKLIAVTSSFDAKVERFARRTNMTREQAQGEVERRMHAQLPDERKAELADYVIENSGTVADAEEQVEKIWQELTAMAGRSRETNAT